MSEKIKISVVINDEKSNGTTNGKEKQFLLLTQDSSMTLMSVLLKNRLMEGSFCGGRGDCGRCVVQFLEGTPLPTGIERARLTPEELRRGYRLACVVRPKADCTVRIVNGGEAKTPIVTEVNLPSEKNDYSGQGKWLSENQKTDAMKSDAGQTGFIVAVDLGTTTVAMQLRDKATGETVDTYCERNPQRVYGTDVLARIEASCNGSRKELQRLVCESLARGLRQFAACLRERPGARILCMCIAGNTTMEHLLLGYEVESLGKAPFVPVETGLQKGKAADLFRGGGRMDRLPGEPAGMEDGIPLDFPVYIAPCVSAFVGGDIVAGLYALDMFPGLPRGKRAGNGAVLETAQTALLIDLGTNGEMAVTDGRRMIVTATAAGPAFEGHGDLIGTDRIALTADLMRRGLLDETGLLAEPYFDEGVPVEAGRAAGMAGSTKENKCYFYKEDIRALQMAKAAVRAGVEILWEEMGCQEVDRVYLAGGFGYYLDVEAAFAIGLLPVHMRGRVQAVGNTSLAGAYELGRDLFEDRIKAGMLEKNLSAAERINLAEKERFETLYLKYMSLEEN